MVADFHYFIEILFGISGRKNVIFLAKFLKTEPRFKDTACRAAVKVLRNQRVSRVRRERFLREEYLAARLFADVSEQLEIFAELFFIDNIARCFNLLRPIQSVPFSKTDFC